MYDDDERKHLDDVHMLVELGEVFDKDDVIQLDEVDDGTDDDEVDDGIDDELDKQYRLLDDDEVDMYIIQVPVQMLQVDIVIVRIIF